MRDVSGAGRTGSILIAPDVIVWRAFLARDPHIVVRDLTLSNTATVASPSSICGPRWRSERVVLFPAFAYLFHIFKRRSASGFRRPTKTSMEEHDCMRAPKQFSKNA